MRRPKPCRAGPNSPPSLPPLGDGTPEKSFTPWQRGRGPPSGNIMHGAIRGFDFPRGRGYLEGSRTTLLHQGARLVIIADLAEIAGRTYPARRRTQNLVGGASPIQAKSFSMGRVTLEPRGGQVPWHNQEQEEIYLILEGVGEMCLGAERSAIQAGQAVYIPPGVFHQLTNTGPAAM